MSLLLAAFACKPTPPPVVTAVVTPVPTVVPEVPKPPEIVVEQPPPPPPATVEQVAVAKDSPASLVRALDGQPPHIVFMAGVCSSAYAYLTTFPEAARSHGGVVAIEGDQPCEGVKGYHSYSWNPLLQRARIEAAFAASGASIPAEGLTLVGYSSGASIAELMHQRWPKLFSRLVLIAPPSDPVAERLRSARAVVAMSCSLDVPYRMKAAVRSLTAVSVATTYVEMPKCTHGQVADGERAFNEAFDWLDLHG
jgi:pimeloyl-ACP methyl ester carboxylesterase